MQQRSPAGVGQGRLWLCGMSCSHLAIRALQILLLLKLNLPIGCAGKEGPMLCPQFPPVPLLRIRQRIRGRQGVCGWVCGGAGNMDNVSDMEAADISAKHGH